MVHKQGSRSSIFKRILIHSNCMFCDSGIWISSCPLSPPAGFKSVSRICRASILNQCDLFLL